MLKPFVEGIWHVESTVKVSAGVIFPCRMTVVRLEGGGLWVHSPVAIDDATAAELAELGPVEHLVAPNTFHHFFMKKMQERFPQTKTWCAPGLETKRADLSFDGVLSDEPRAEWAGQIDQKLVGGTVLNEVLFFHRASQTVIITDLVFNMSPPYQGFMTPWVLRMAGANGRTAQSRLARLLTKDRGAAGRDLQSALDAWPIERASVAHGEPIAQGARALIEGATTWMRAGA